jgi:hypothetical protein
MAGAAVAAELAPQSGYSVHLTDVNGTVYYTVEQDGYRVVATLASGEGLPIRFIATLARGQRILVSVPQSVDEPPIDFEILRDGDALRVGDPVPAVTANLASPAPTRPALGD